MRSAARANKHLTGPLVGRHPNVAPDESMARQLELHNNLGRLARNDEGSMRQDAWIRFTNSRTCLCIYFLLMLLNIFVLILEISGRNIPMNVLVSVVCEGFINLFLVGEVVIGLVVYHWDYFKPCGNRVDFVITFLCLIFYAVFIEEEAPGAGKVLGDDFEYADTILLGFRYAFQVFRFVSIFRRGQQKKAHIVADEIDFDADDATGIELQNFGQDEDDEDNSLVALHSNRQPRSDSFCEVDLHSLQAGSSDLDQSTPNKVQLGSSLAQLTP
mmetsp:Transcript_19206/g.26959  ORF Transcript_19206/g.26959 Transcript_19206/m.26959 type:complete len:272 (-) Transcript_19206:238-1053(-)|eukprot:CAMPEP_0175100856 /NCGR_PEP_ID=MMETSP0086_2-20121207/7389_1 /TAXON_ID=136419 /ORGANISM="Unknown Unknown, Strain D1" /LENGTH=271 /DNA_ID=CAMNT_0016375153 /DNA_START=283 /DNA_END=1098 /DNA_ORIENTATION=-